MEGKEGSGQAHPIPTGPTPWLLFEHLNAGHTFSTAFSDKRSYFRELRPELRGKRIVESQYEWLILDDVELDDDVEDCYAITLWNPATSKSISLPRLYLDKDTSRPENIILTSPPLDDYVNDNDNDNCFVMVFSAGHVFACPLKPDSDYGVGASSHWFSERIEVEGDDRAFVQMGVALNGAVYCTCYAVGDALDTKTCLVSIQVVGANSLAIRYLSIKLPDDLFSEVLQASSDYLVESSGAIYVAQVGTHYYNWAHDVKVWKLDLERQITVPVKNLGDRAFFLSYKGSTWSCTTLEDCDCDYSGGVQRNCLYVYSEDVTYDAVLKYSLDDCTSTYLPCPRLREPYNPNALWVAPQLPRSVPNCNKHRIDKDEILSKSRLVDSAKEKNELIQSSKTRREYITRLPNDLIRLLGKFLHLFDYWNFRCISEMIKAVTPAPGWRTNNVFPLFLVFDNDAGSCRLRDPCRNDSRPCHLQLSQKYFGVEFSKDGWLLISDGEHLQFFNPFTRVRQDLPSLGDSFDKIAFSTRPTCAECLTVSIETIENGLVFNYHRYGDTIWNTCSFDNTSDICFYPSDATPIYHSGAFYFLDRQGYLGVLEWVGGEMSWRVYKQPLAHTPKFHSCYLVKYGEELLAVVIGRIGKYVSVYKFDQPKKQWVRVKSIGNHVLFVSPYSSSSVATTDVKMADRIYLPWMKGEHIVYYSLKTHKYHVDDSQHYSRGDFFFFKNPSRCCWI